MLKFFRKYNKTLIAVFMTLLMIVFVGGTALQDLFTPETNIVVATSKFGEIDRKAQRRAKFTTDILLAMGLNWEQPGGTTGEPLELVDWILLTREAGHFQTIATEAAISSWVKQERDALDVIDGVARRIGTKREHVLAAVGEYLSVQLTSQALAGALAPSTAAIRSLARDTLSKVQVAALVLPAAAFADAYLDFSEDELTTQWEEHRDVKPGDGLNFGYYVEPALKVQYVKIDRDAIVDDVRVPNHEKRARRYYDQNRETDRAFAREANDTAGEAESNDAEVDEEGGADDGPAERPPYLTWEEAKDTAMEIVRTQHAAEAAERIASWICSYDAQHWLDVSRNPDGYKTPPEAVANPDFYEKMVGQIPKAISYPGAVAIKRAGPFFQSDAAALDDIGAATLRTERRGEESFGTVAFRSQPIVAKVPTESGTDFTDYLSMYQTCPFPLVDSDGNLYVFRVDDVDPGHASRSLDEVRDRVVTDVRLLRGYEIAQAWGATIREQAAGGSLEETVQADSELTELLETGSEQGAGLFESTFVTRVEPTLAAYGIDLKAVNAGPNIGRVPGELVESWFELEYAADKMDVYELPDRALVLVAEWIETQPPDFEQFEQIRANLAEQIARNQRRVVMSDWFAPEHVRARNAFRLLEN